MSPKRISIWKEVFGINNVLNFNHMRVGQKGGGKHWTKKEVESRKEAGEKFKRKKKKTLKIPAWLSSEATKVWKKTVKDMAEFDILDNVDEDVLATYCDAVAKHQEANEEIEKSGLTEINAAGNRVPSAHVKVAQSYARIILSYSEKLGLTAGARARMAKAIADGQKDDPNGELFD